MRGGPFYPRVPEVHVGQLQPEGRGQPRQWKAPDQGKDFCRFTHSNYIYAHSVFVLTAIKIKNKIPPFLAEDNEASRCYTLITRLNKSFYN